MGVSHSSFKEMWQISTGQKPRKPRVVNEVWPQAVLRQEDDSSLFAGNWPIDNKTPASDSGYGAIPTPCGEGTRTRELIFHIMLGLGRVPVTVRTGRQSPDPLTDQHVKPTRSLCLLGGKAGTQNSSPRTLHKDRNITGLLLDFSS